MRDLTKKGKDLQVVTQLIREINGLTVEMTELQVRKDNLNQQLSDALRREFMGINEHAEEMEDKK